MRAGRYIVDPEWYKIVLKAGQASVAEEAYIHTLFNRAYANRRGRAGMSLWIERDSDGTATYFLSPISVTSEPGLVHHLNAVRATAPSATSTLVAGSRLENR